MLIIIRKFQFKLLSIVTDSCNPELLPMTSEFASIFVQNIRYLYLVFNMPWNITKMSQCNENYINIYIKFILTMCI